MWMPHGTVTSIEAYQIFKKQHCTFKEANVFLHAFPRDVDETQTFLGWLEIFSDWTVDHRVQKCWPVPQLLLHTAIQLAKKKQLLNLSFPPSLDKLIWLWKTISGCTKTGTVIVWKLKASVPSLWLWRFCFQNTFCKLRAAHLQSSQLLAGYPSR